MGQQIFLHPMGGFYARFIFRARQIACVGRTHMSLIQAGLTYISAQFFANNQECGTQKVQELWSDLFHVWCLL